MGRRSIDISVGCPKIDQANLDIIEQCQWNQSKHLIIGNAKADRCIELGIDKKQLVEQIVQLLDGTHTMTEINQQLSVQYHTKVDVTSLVKGMGNIGLIEGIQATECCNELDAVGIRLINVTFEQMLPNIRKFLSTLFCIGKGLYAVSLVLFFTILIIFFQEFLEKNILNLIIERNSLIKIGVSYYAISWAVLFIHELAHIAAMAYYGVAVKQISISLYMGLYPLYYSKAKGIYRLDVKERMVIIGAGLASNLTMLLVSLMLLIILPATSPVCYWLVIIMVCNLMMIVSSISPFSLSDGYFLFSSIFGLKNVRTKMFVEGIRGIKKTYKVDKKTALLYILYDTMFGVMMIGSVAALVIYISGIIKEVYSNYPLYVTVIVLVVTFAYVGFICYSLWKKIKFWRKQDDGS